MVLKGQGKGEDSMSMTKPMAAKFIQKPKGNSHTFASTTSSSMGGHYTEADVQVIILFLRYLNFMLVKESIERYVKTEILKFK